MSKMQNHASGQEANRQASKPAYLVLVAEDHEDSRIILKTMLELNDMRVVEANDGEAAVNIALNEHPDLILMDLNLPQLDGIAAMRRIREAEKLRQVPIVFITAYDGDNYRNAVFNAGGNDFLAKPISAYAFYRTLKRFFPSAASNENLANIT